MTPSTNEPETNIDIASAVKVIADLAESIGYTTDRNDSACIRIHTSEDTFISVKTSGAGYFWGALEDYSTVQPGYITHPVGLYMLSIALIEHSARNIEKVWDQAD